MAIFEENIVKQKIQNGKCKFTINSNAKTIKAKVTVSAAVKVAIVYPSLLTPAILDSADSNSKITLLIFAGQEFYNSVDGKPSSKTSILLDPKLIINRYLRIQPWQDLLGEFCQKEPSPVVAPSPFKTTTEK